MDNRTFLDIWFPLSWILVFGGACGVVWLLRKSFLDLASRFVHGFSRATMVMFPAGILLPAFAGFLSVSYFGKGCGRYSSSTDVIADTEHLHRVAEQQVGSTAEWLLVALLVWAAFYTVLVIIWKNSHREAPAAVSPEESNR